MVRVLSVAGLEQYLEDYRQVDGWSYDESPTERPLPKRKGRKRKSAAVVAKVAPPAQVPIELGQTVPQGEIK